jgi:hypothetical protein
MHYQRWYSSVGHLHPVGGATIDLAGIGLCRVHKHSPSHPAAWAWPAGRIGP